jgi:anti-repressor protein
MNTDIQIFRNEMFGEVRVAEINGEPYFVGRDVAAALGYEKPYNAITQHVDLQDTLKQGIPDSQGFMQETIIINESGLYSLIFGSKLGTAKEFKRWVTSDVLPSVRKHGGYLTPQKIEEALLNPDTIIQLATSLKEERQKRLDAESTINEQQKVIAAQAPKALFADAVATSDRSVLVSELAKIIKQNGIDIGQNRLFIWLREHGYLCSKGEYYNQPTQKAMELGLFEIKKVAINKPDGTVLTTTTTKVSGKGQIYFVNKFLNVAA